jgi:lipid-A-disaccharide synthase-like uncharacterized protein
MMRLGTLLIAASPCAAAAPEVPNSDYAQILTRIEQENLSEEEVAQLIALAERIKAKAKTQLTLAQRIERALLQPWVMFGFLAQFAFMMRFVVQLIASERKKRSYVPVAFWYLSLLGGVMLLVYALKLRDPVFVLGQGLGCFIYVRNLLLIYKRREAYRELQETRSDVRGTSA